MFIQAHGFLLARPLLNYSGTCSVARLPNGPECRPKRHVKFNHS